MTEVWEDRCIQHRLWETFATLGSAIMYTALLRIRDARNFICTLRTMRMI